MDLFRLLPTLYYTVRCAECDYRRHRLFRHQAIRAAAAHQCLAEHDDVFVTGIP